MPPQTGSSRSVTGVGDLGAPKVVVRCRRDLKLGERVLLGVESRGIELRPEFPDTCDKGPAVASIEQLGKPFDGRSRSVRLPSVPVPVTVRVIVVTSSRLRSAAQKMRYRPVSSEQRTVADGGGLQDIRLRYSTEISMKAVRFDVTIPGFVVAKSLGKVWRAMLGALGTVRLQHTADPVLPGSEWVGLEVLGCGICGSDVSTVTYSMSPALEPFSSFPAVLGHEILARVTEVGAEVDRVRVGQRVNVDPMISCTVRGHSSPCPACPDGSTALCHQCAEAGRTKIDDRPLSEGTLMGYHRDLPGGFGERIIAHQSQLYPLPGEIDDDTAILTEPISIALHGVLLASPVVDGPVLVIGSGTIPLATIWALRATGYRAILVSQTKRPHEARLAKLLGAKILCGQARRRGRR